MKIQNTGSSSTVSGPRRPVDAGGSGFELSGAEARPPSSAAPNSAVGSLGSLGALLALQETPSPLERRRRAVRRASGLLDALDAVKLSCLEVGSAATSLEGLRRAVREEQAKVEDAALQAVLDEIETRAAVELAKEEMTVQARAAAA